LEVNEMSEETQAPAAEDQAPIQLGLNDLAAVIQIIDVCSKRGAFEGAELESVGQVRGRIAAFVQANAPKKEEGDAEAEAPAEEPAAE
jgi:hypothetical protein